MIELIAFIVLALFILIVYEVREHGKKGISQQESASAAGVTSDDGECCGQHLVCERESLLQSNAQIEYYDDEELDALAGLNPAEYTEAQQHAVREVFDTLQEKDVAGWVRSLQLRNIALPEDIREEALLIVRERRERNTDRKTITETRTDGPGK